MARIAFILLCHKDPDAVAAQAERLSSEGDYVALHFDARSGPGTVLRLAQRLSGNDRVRVVDKPVKCGWGEWSLVKATLRTLKTALDAFPDATHFYLVSGDCQPIKSAAYVHGALAPGDRDHIEAVDFFASDWIRTGLREDRLRYRHFFNERKNKELFYRSLRLQRKLGLERPLPRDLRIMIGSQWWCLRRATVDALFAFMADRPDVARFFSTTWIPDETFFQTLVSHLVPRAELTGAAPTFLMFSDYGMPVTFYDDHLAFLQQQDAFFARKISDEAADLRTALHALWNDTNRDFEVAGDGRHLHGFLTGRGRVGRRFAPRFWEEGKPARRRELLLVASKKWNVAKRLTGFAREQFGIPGVDFAFHEAECPLPDLGGIQGSVEKRNRHRRAVVSMLFDSFQTDRLMLCLDVSADVMICDFYASRMQVRLLEIECHYSDAFLLGHAQRLGLLHASSSSDSVARALPALRQEIAFEHQKLSEGDFPGAVRISETAAPEQNAEALAAFFGQPLSKAAPIAETSLLFND